MTPEIETAAALAGSGRFDEARALCMQIISRAPDVVEARCILATIELQTSSSALGAQPWLRQAAALNPAYPPLHYYLSAFHGARGDAMRMDLWARRATILLDPPSAMAASLREHRDSWRWLDDRPGEFAGRPATPSREAKRWLFVWRDLGEFLYHFDRAGVGTRDTLWLPAPKEPSAGLVDAELLSRADRERPDVVVFLPGTGAHRNPSLGTIRTLKARGIPVVLVLPDMRKAYWQGIVSIAGPAFDLVVSFDGCTLESLPGLRPLGERFFRGWTPISSSGEPPPLAGRPYAVNMIGSLWGDRLTAARALTAAGIQVIVRPPPTAGTPVEPGMPTHKTLSNDTYLDLVRQCRLTVNFSACSTGDGHQLKGRVFEAAVSGSMLLESANDMTGDFFEYGKEFVSFTDEADLVAKVRHYLAHPEQAAAIAAAAHRRFVDSYAAPHFWRALYERARLRRLEA